MPDPSYAPAANFLYISLQRNILCCSCGEAVVQLVVFVVCDGSITQAFITVVVYTIHTEQGREGETEATV